MSSGLPSNHRALRSTGMDNLTIIIVRHARGPAVAELGLGLLQ